MPSIADDLARLALLLLLVGCSGETDKTETVNVQVCSRGDRESLQASIRGATYEVQLLDANGDIQDIASFYANDWPSGLDVPLTATPTTVRVIGQGFTGPFASGQAPYERGTTCVCFAFDSQHQVACEGVRCSIASDSQCQFLDEVTGNPVGPRTLLFGENTTDDVRQVTRDTWLSSVVGEENDSHGGDAEIRADPVPPDDVARTLLLQFDLSVLPSTSQITAAELVLTHSDNPSAGSDGTLRLFRVLEPWDEDTASWNNRDQLGLEIPWAVPGCGYVDGTLRSREGTSFAEESPDTTQTTFPMTAVVAGWVANRNSEGVAGVLYGGTSAIFWSSEAVVDGGRPRLAVTYTLE